MKEELFLKYLNNNCSDKEFEEFVSWVKKETGNKEGKNWVFDHWESFNPDLSKKK